MFLEEQPFKETNRRGRLDTVVLDRGKRIERVLPCATKAHRCDGKRPYRQSFGHIPYSINFYEDSLGLYLSSIVRVLIVYSKVAECFPSIPFLFYLIRIEGESSPESRYARDIQKSAGEKGV